MINWIKFYLSYKTNALNSYESQNVNKIVLDTYIKPFLIFVLTRVWEVSIIWHTYNYLPTQPSFVSVLGSAVTVCTATSASLILVCKSLRSSIKSSFKTSDGCWIVTDSDDGGSGWGAVFRILQSAAKRILGSGCGLIPAIVDTLSTPALNVGHETGIKINSSTELALMLRILENTMVNFSCYLQLRLSNGFEDITFGVACFGCSTLAFLYLSTEIIVKKYKNHSLKNCIILIKITNHCLRIQVSQHTTAANWAVH